MMKTRLTQALKEWAIVCRVLGDGRQIFIARKGGVAEEEGEFVVENHRFLLFPTYLHQEKELLKPSFHFEYRIVSEQGSPKKLHLTHYASVTDQIEVSNPEIFKKIFDHHLWTEQVLQARFNWGNGPGLRLLVLRVYRLPEEITVPMKKEYGGCKSWVTIDREIPTVGSSPVLNDVEFSDKRAALLRLVS